MQGLHAVSIQTCLPSKTETNIPVTMAWARKLLRVLSVCIESILVEILINDEQHSIQLDHLHSTSAHLKLEAVNLEFHASTRGFGN